MKNSVNANMFVTSVNNKYSTAQKKAGAKRRPKLQLCREGTTLPTGHGLVANRTEYLTVNAGAAGVYRAACRIDPTGINAGCRFTLNRTG